MRSFAISIVREFSKGNCPVNLGTEGVVAQMVLCVEPSPHLSVSVPGGTDSESLGASFDMRTAAYPYTGFG